MAQQDRAAGQQQHPKRPLARAQSDGLAAHPRRGGWPGGVGPIMQVLVDGILVGSEVKSTDHADYRLCRAAHDARGASSISPSPTTPSSTAPTATSSSPTPPPANTVWLPRCCWQHARPGAGRRRLRRRHRCRRHASGIILDGALRAPPGLSPTSPAPSPCAPVPCPPGGVGALMLLWADGVAVSSAQVNSTAPTWTTCDAHHRAQAGQQGRRHLRQPRHRRWV